MIIIMQTIRIHEMGIFTAKIRCFLIHHVGEGGNGAGNMLGHTDGCLIGRL